MQSTYAGETNSRAVSAEPPTPRSEVVAFSSPCERRTRERGASPPARSSLRPSPDPIPPKFRSVQQPNTGRFGLEDAEGSEPVYGSTSGWRRDPRERQRAARRASPARGRVGAGMMGDTTTRTGQSRFPGRPLRLRLCARRTSLSICSNTSPSPLAGREADEVPTIPANRKWAKRCAVLVPLRGSGRIADATEAHLRWAQTPLGYLASPDLPDHGPF